MFLCIISNGPRVHKRFELKARTQCIFQDWSDDREDRGERQEDWREHSTVVVVLDGAENARVGQVDVGGC